MRLLGFFRKRPSFCFECGSKLEEYVTTRDGVTEYLLLACPERLNPTTDNYRRHFLEVVSKWKYKKKYNIYTGEKLNGSEDSLRRKE